MIKIEVEAGTLLERRFFQEIVKEKLKKIN